jgi:beta-glucosidase
MDYKNSSLSPEQRAKSLLSIMTLEEKVAQIDIIRGVEFSTKPHKLYHCAIEPDSEIDYKKLKETLGENGIGLFMTPILNPKYLICFKSSSSKIQD